MHHSRFQVDLIVQQRVNPYITERENSLESMATGMLMLSCVILIVVQREVRSCSVYATRWYSHCQTRVHWTALRTARVPPYRTSAVLRSG